MTTPFLLTHLHFHAPPETDNPDDCHMIGLIQKGRTPLAWADTRGPNGLRLTQACEHARHMPPIETVRELLTDAVRRYRERDNPHRARLRMAMNVRPDLPPEWTRVRILLTAAVTGEKPSRSLPSPLLWDGPPDEELMRRRWQGRGTRTPASEWEKAATLDEIFNELENRP